MKVIVHVTERSGIYTARWSVLGSFYREKCFTSFSSMEKYLKGKFGGNYEGRFS